MISNQLGRQLSKFKNFNQLNMKCNLTSVNAHEKIVRPNLNIISIRNFHTESTPEELKTLNANYLSPKGEMISVKCAPGQNLLVVAHENDIELEGACECSVACSTCHV
mmetsp:Transcript_27450/g.60376  ORF Transcript_27450/g.60376 Transcript_27450/m.60376 type:complete len:108 (+) Transcript_27450:1-324(+)